MTGVPFWREAAASVALLLAILCVMGACIYGAIWAVARLERAAYRKDAEEAERAERETKPNAAERAGTRHRPRWNPR